MDKQRRLELLTMTALGRSILDAEFARGAGFDPSQWRADTYQRSSHLHKKGDPCFRHVKSGRVIDKLPDGHEVEGNRVVRVRDEWTTPGFLHEPLVKQWGELTSPSDLLMSLASPAGDFPKRKTSLLMAAVARSVEGLAADPRTSAAINMVEAKADAAKPLFDYGPVLRAAQDAAHEVREGPHDQFYARRTAWHALIACTMDHIGDSQINQVLHNAEWAVAHPHATGGLRQSGVVRAEQAKQSDLIRAVFPNPWAPVTMKRAWVTPDVHRLAESAYKDKDAQALPVLADALEEAGCTSQPLLDALRKPTPVVRGNWALDLVLRK